MALKVAREDHNGLITTYHKIERVMVNYSGEGSIEIVIGQYAKPEIRERQKAGEVCGAVGERNEYLPLGDQDCSREKLYQRLKDEVADFADAEDV